MIELTTSVENDVALFPHYPILIISNSCSVHDIKRIKRHQKNKANNELVPILVFKLVENFRVQ